MAGKSIDECVTEIFETHKNIGNLSSWRTMKSRFFDGKLSDRAKKKLLEEHGYEVVDEAKYDKKGEE